MKRITISLDDGMYGVLSSLANENMRTLSGEAVYRISKTLQDPIVIPSTWNSTLTNKNESITTCSGSDCNVEYNDWLAANTDNNGSIPVDPGIKSK